MENRLLIVTGKDRPGIVSAVSGFLAHSGINLEDVRMSILEGQFAMMLIVCVPPKARKTLGPGLAQLEKSWKLSIFQCPLALRLNRKGNRSFRTPCPVLIRVIGRDRTGIVAGISQILARRGCNITDLQCRILGSGSKAIYTMLLEAEPPAGVTLKSLQAQLKRLQHRLHVEIHAGAADVVKL